MTIAFLSVMIALVISGFIFISYQEAKVEEERKSTRTLRVARQAVMETGAAVAELMIRRDSEPNLLRYAQTLNRLNTFADDSFPATALRGSDEIPTPVIITALKAGWADVVSAVAAKQPEIAQSLYGARGIERHVTVLTRAILADLTRKEALEASFNANIERATSIVLGLQIMTGAFCILAFMGASRSSARDARTRDLAVANANASREQVSRLFGMTEMLQSALDHTDANAVLRATAAELIPDLGGALYVFNNSRDRLALSTTWGREELEALPDSIGLQQCWALKRGKPHMNRPGSHNLCCEHHIVSDRALEIPMIARGEILGLLQLYCSGAEADRRLEGAAGIGTALADAMSLALSNIALRDKLRSQALRDPLTGLYNRRYMEDALERVVRLAERERTEVSVIMIDLDHFKRLNDQYGHAKGDAVLRDSAAAIINQLRETDIACRYGGEELIVVLPNCGLDMAAQKAERIRASIEALSEPNGAQVSASLGVACVPATSNSSRDLLAHSDAALYRAKQEGRNRVVRAPSHKTKGARMEQSGGADSLAAE
ncbi:sensor domain-containing diguanylate cyclase [Bosea sp. (in: a-proteobacteria)]|uniref:GGDEF domain-containing protein n=1 Tax=Bosea sp. (in: a-proteobacteria) TaxID=1871050 RepID=UPI002DDD6CF9|nr:sensor domain-containing diguanylate cyclase [Bosea sp. (in: a-proteobacteria)]HEV2513362.1 sensor domain-containing diguanylate cyclase [Bosea sp. (in: a-proteobacteria)]